MSNKGLSYGQKIFLSFCHTNKLLAVPHCQLTYCVQYVLHLWTWTKILVCVCRLSRVQLFVTPPGSPSVQFSRQECWSGLPFLSPGDLSNPGIEPTSLTSPACQADSLPLVPPGKPQDPCWGHISPLFIYYFLNTLWGMQDLSSPTRDQTRALCSGGVES